MDAASKIYDTTIEGVVGYMKDREKGFNYLVLRDLVGTQVTLHITDDAVKELLQRFKAGPVPYDDNEDPRFASDQP